MSAYSASLEAMNRGLKRENAELIRSSGMEQLNRAMDSTLIALGKVYGVPEFDEGAVAGYRMEIPMPSVKALDTYKVKADKFEKDGVLHMRIGIVSVV